MTLKTLMIQWGGGLSRLSTGSLGLLLFNNIIFAREVVDALLYCKY